MSIDSVDPGFKRRLRSDDAGRDGNERNLLEIIREGKLLIVAGIVLGAAVAAAYLALTPPQYFATAGVLIEGRSSPVSASERIQSSAPLEIPEIESQVELISSTKVVGAALAALPPDIQRDLQSDRPSLFAQAKGFVAGLIRSFIKPAPAVAEEPDAMRDRIDAARGKLSVRRVGSSYVIEIGYTAVSAKAAAAVANAVASAFVQNEVKDKSDMWRRAGSWMQQRLNEVGSEAAAAARAAQEFKAANRIVESGTRGPIDEQQLQEISSSVIDAKARVVEAQSKLEEAKKILLAGSNGNIPDSLTDNVVAKLREQAAALRQQVSQLQTALGPDHEAVLKTKADLHGVDVALAEELKRHVQSLQSNYDVAVARLDSLQSSFDAVVARSTLTGRAVVQAKELERTAETYNKLYADLLQRYTDAVNQESFPIAGAQIISEAVPPKASNAPRSAVALVLGLFGGSGLAILLVFARELSDRPISMSQQIESLGTHCFGLLPILDRDPDFARHAASMMDTKDLPRRAAADRVRAQFLVHNPGSLFAHSVQTLKTHLVMAGSNHANQVIGITSARSGDGKSTIAANLATLFSTHGKRTLLIDADLYNPTTSTLLDLSSRAGLAEVLQGDMNFQKTVRAVEGRGLSVLSSGRADLMTVDGMLGSARFRTLLASARRQYDYIILDLPPVDEVVSTREIAPLLDGVVLVATWGKTRLRTLDAALQVFDRDRTKVLGVVLNKAAPRSVPNHAAYAAYSDRLRKRANA